MSPDSVYDLYRRGTGLLEAGDHHAAIIPLTQARDAEPEKTSIREALGRALFYARRYEQAAAEFEAVVDRAPTNDFALFCLGRSLQQLGRHAEARQPPGGLRRATGVVLGRSRAEHATLPASSPVVASARPLRHLRRGYAARSRAIVAVRTSRPRKRSSIASSTAATGTSPLT